MTAEKKEERPKKKIERVVGEAIEEDKNKIPKGWKRGMKRYWMIKMSWEKETKQKIKPKITKK